MDSRLADTPRHTDLYIYQCGALMCEKGHAYGPAVRDHFLIHYVHSGRGIFQINNDIYHLSAGSGFLICPDIVTYYQADEEDPWNYSWIGFHGIKAEVYLKDAGLTLETPIFQYNKDSFISDCFNEMANAYYLKRGGEVKRLAYLYLFLDKMIQLNPKEVYYHTSESRREAYITRALQYIEMNYSRKISIDLISRHVGLNRSYFNEMFRSELKMTLKEYLIEYRVRKACELLANQQLLVGDIARSVGYEDPLLFSKIFKKIKGIPPNQYRCLLQ